jgi:hypothetical protein
LNTAILLFFANGFLNDIIGEELKLLKKSLRTCKSQTPCSADHEIYHQAEGEATEADVCF